MNELNLKQNKSGIHLPIKLIPNASTDEVIGVMADGSLKIKVKAPPVDNRANLALLKFLRELFNLPLNNLTIVKGPSTRKKLILVKGIEKESLLKNIRAALSDGPLFSQ